MGQDLSFGFGFWIQLQIGFGIRVGLRLRFGIQVWSSSESWIRVEEFLSNLVMDLIFFVLAILSRETMSSILSLVAWPMSSDRLVQLVELELFGHMCHHSISFC